MKIGYARTSTVEQSAGFVDQKRELRRAGVERLYSEQVSAVAQSRPQFDLIIASLRKGDVVIVTKLDRLARSMADLIKIITAIKVAGASEAQPDAQPLTRSNPTHKHPAHGGCLIPRLTTN